MRVVKHFVDLNKIILGYSCAKVIKYFVKNEIYLISERENEAEDNGYHLYKYIRENYPKEKAYYLVNKNSKGYKRVKELGNIIDYDSLKHYIYYFLSKKHISAFQFFGVPNSALIWFLESKGFFKKQRIFLQHGITKENIPALKYENKKYDLFICGGKPEHNYIKEYFGYPEQSVIYTGFSRYDELHNRKKNKKQILLMPTWRQWLGMTNMGNDKNQDYKNLIKSDYYKSYMSFINSNELNLILKENNYELLFYLHPEAQRFRDYFTTENLKVKIISRENVILQDLLKESEILITDYSSIAFDFAYMRKKVLYYQFDSEEYYKKHYSKSYFDYEKHGFGEVHTKEEDLIRDLKNLLKEKQLEKKYLKRIEEFFPLYDTNNSKRIFQYIRGL